MPTIAHTDVIIPSGLTVAARQQLTDDLYQVHCQIFDGVDKESFAKYVVESKAQQTAIHLHKNAAGAIVGYCALHVFEKDLHGRPAAVIRAEAGSLREYRGNNINSRIGISFVLRYWLAHPARPLFYLGTLVHPSSYMFFARYADLVWPNRTQPIPADIATFMAALADTFGLEAVEAHNPLVVHVGWRTIDTEVERAYWRTCDKPTARFYVQENPNYHLGHGLMTLVPLTVSGITHLVGRFLGEQTQQRFGPTIIAAQQLPIARQLLGLRLIEQRLKQTPLFAGLPAADLRDAARAAEVITFPAGRYVFQAGDSGDELYVVASGAVVVVVTVAGAEYIIDQIAPGAMFGEIAMLSGEPRSATIRTAAKTTLLRIKRKVLLTLMETHPQMRDTIWGLFARRRFMDLTARNTAYLSMLSRQQRLDWFTHGQIETLAAQTAATISEPWLFILTGTVEMQQNDAWLTIRAPALMQVVPPLQLIAQTSAQIVRLPAVMAASV